MLTQKEKMEFTKLFSPWEKLTKQQQALLEETVLCRNFKKEEMIHNGQLDCSGIYIVRQGVLRVYFLSENGKEITLCRLFERDCCLYSAACMLKDLTFQVHISAEKEASLFLIPTSIFQSLSKESLLVSSFTNQMLASHFSDVVGVMEQVLFTSFDKRLATFLLEQSSIEEADMICMTQEEMAHHLGTAREVVTRMLKEFQESGLVRLFRGGIQILNREGLKNKGKLFN